MFKKRLAYNHGFYPIPAETSNVHDVQEPDAVRSPSTHTLHSSRTCGNFTNGPFKYGEFNYPWHIDGDKGLSATLELIEDLYFWLRDQIQPKGESILKSLDIWFSFFENPVLDTEEFESIKAQLTNKNNELETLNNWFTSESKYRGIGAFKQSLKYRKVKGEDALEAIYKDLKSLNNAIENALFSLRDKVPDLCEVLIEKNNFSKPYQLFLKKVTRLLCSSRVLDRHNLSKLIDKVQHFPDKINGHLQEVVAMSRILQRTTHSVIQVGELTELEIRRCLRNSSTKFQDIIDNVFPDKSASGVSYAADVIVWPLKHEGPPEAIQIKTKFLTDKDFFRSRGMATAKIFEKIREATYQLNGVTAQNKTLAIDPDDKTRKGVPKFKQPERVPNSPYMKRIVQIELPKCAPFDMALQRLIRDKLNDPYNHVITIAGTKDRPIYPDSIRFVFNGGREELEYASDGKTYKLVNRREILKNFKRTETYDAKMEVSEAASKMCLNSTDTTSGATEQEKLAHQRGMTGILKSFTISSTNETPSEEEPNMDMVSAFGLGTVFDSMNFGIKNMTIAGLDFFQKEAQQHGLTIKSNLNEYPNLRNMAISLVDDMVRFYTDGVLVPDNSKYKQDFKKLLDITIGFRENITFEKLFMSLTLVSLFNSRRIDYGRQTWCEFKTDVICYFKDSSDLSSLLKKYFILKPLTLFPRCVLLPTLNNRINEATLVGLSLSGTHPDQKGYPRIWLYHDEVKTRLFGKSIEQVKRLKEANLSDDTCKLIKQARTAVIKFTDYMPELDLFLNFSLFGSLPYKGSLLESLVNDPTISRAKFERDYENAEVYTSMSAALKTFYKIDTPDIKHFEERLAGSLLKFSSALGKVNTRTKSKTDKDLTTVPQSKEVSDLSVFIDEMCGTLNLTEEYLIRFRNNAHQKSFSDVSLSKDELEVIKKARSEIKKVQILDMFLYFSLFSESSYNESFLKSLVQNPEKAKSACDALNRSKMSKLLASIEEYYKGIYSDISQSTIRKIILQFCISMTKLCPKSALSSSPEVSSFIKALGNSITILYPKGACLLQDAVRKNLENGSVSKEVFETIRTGRDMVIRTSPNRVLSLDLFLYFSLFSSYPYKESILESFLNDPNLSGNVVRRNEETSHYTDMMKSLSEFYCKKLGVNISRNEISKSIRTFSSVLFKAK